MIELIIISGSFHSKYTIRSMHMTVLYYGEQLYSEYSILINMNTKSRTASRSRKTLFIKSSAASPVVPPAKLLSVRYSKEVKQYQYVLHRSLSFSSCKGKPQIPSMPKPKAKSIFLDKKVRFDVPQFKIQLRSCIFAKSSYNIQAAIYK